MTGLRARIAAVASLLALFGFLTIANFIPEEQRVASPLIPDSGLRLGLDLQGGIHWVLGVNLSAAIDHELEFLSGGLREAAESEDFIVDDVDVEDQRLVVDLLSDATAASVREWASQTNVLREVEAGEDQLVFSLTDQWSQEVGQRAMAQVLEVLRRRIDDPIRGIPDSVVTRQGKDRVLVQIPGGQIDRTRARKILEVTGFLEFKLVKASAPSEDLLRNQFEDGLPEDTAVVYERDKETQRVISAYLVADSADLTGDYLTDARVDFDRQQRPIVSFTFN
ncbi:MAG: hypothetical protein ACE5FL_15995, partial [Myxococcota bacterium]